MDLALAHKHEEVMSLYFTCRDSQDEKSAKVYFNDLISKVCKLFIGEELFIYPIVWSVDPSHINVLRELVCEHMNIKFLLNELCEEKRNENYEIKLRLTMENLMNHFFKEEEMYKEIKEKISEEERSNIYNGFGRLNRMKSISNKDLLTNKSEEFTNYIIECK